MLNFHPGSSDELKPRITVIGVGGAGGNAVNNMIQSHLEGVEFIVANTDAQAMMQSRTDRRIQLGATTTQGLGAGARPEVGRAAAEESLDELIAQMAGSNMVFITAGMGGGTGTGAAPVIARAARDNGILTVGVVTKPFSFEGLHRQRLADQGIDELSQYVDTLIIIPNQNLFRVASERTTFADAFKMADDVLYSGVRGVTDLMIKPGLINLDFADIRTVMGEMGKAVMGTGEAEGDKRALDAAEAAINNPLLEDLSMKGARGVLINITGGLDMTLFEADEAANRIRDEVDPDANIIFGSTFDESMNGRIRVSVVATGIDAAAQAAPKPTLISLVEAKAPQKPATVQSFTPKAAPTLSVPTLAERVAGTAHVTHGPVSHGSAAVAHAPAAAPQFQAETVAAPEPMIASVMEIEDEDELLLEEAAFAETSMVEAPVAPAAALREALLRPEPAPAMRAEPSLAPAAEPAQGSLRMDPPVARAPQAPVAAPAAPAAPQASEAARRPSFLNRLTGMKAPTATPAASQSYAPQHHAPAAQPAAHRPAPQAETPAAAPQTRISPSDRLTTSRAADEDLLDIPAFLRRQAN